MAAGTPPTSTTFYYDPVLEVHHKLPVSAALTTSYYAAPQEPDDARLLFDAARTSAGLDGELALPLAAGRGVGSTLILAREWGLTELDERLSAAIEASFEPTWDGATGEFTWGMGLNEAHPRGQFNAFLAAAEAAGPGMWSRVSAAPLQRCPQVVDVDFPTVALRRAEWIEGVLHLAVAPLAPDATTTTTFRITDPGPGAWAVEGHPGASAVASGPDVTVTAPTVEIDLRLRRSR